MCRMRQALGDVYKYYEVQAEGKLWYVNPAAVDLRLYLQRLSEAEALYARRYKALARALMSPSQRRQLALCGPERQRMELDAIVKDSAHTHNVQLPSSSDNGDRDHKCDDGQGQDGTNAGLLSVSSLTQNAEEEGKNVRAVRGALLMQRELERVEDTIERTIAIYDDLHASSARNDRERSDSQPKDSAAPSHTAATTAAAEASRRTKSRGGQSRSANKTSGVRAKAGAASKRATSKRVPSSPRRDRGAVDPSGSRPPNARHGSRHRPADRHVTVHERTARMRGEVQSGAHSTNGHRSRGHRSRGHRSRGDGGGGGGGRRPRSTGVPEGWSDLPFDDGDFADANGQGHAAVISRRPDGGKRLHLDSDISSSSRVAARLSPASPAHGGDLAAPEADGTPVLVPLEQDGLFYAATSRGVTASGRLAVALADDSCSGYGAEGSEWAAPRRAENNGAEVEVAMESVILRHPTPRPSLRQGMHAAAFPMQFGLVCLLFSMRND